MVQTIVILHAHIPQTGLNRLTAAVDGRVVRGTWSRTEDSTEARAKIIAAFLDLWEARTDDVVALHVSDRVVAGMIKEQLDSYEGLYVRDVITGKGIRETFAVCSDSTIGRT